jgi:glycosyltransferase involved in cell wall biosynthesis
MFNTSVNNKRLAFVSNSAWSIYNFRLDVITHLINQGYEVLVLAPDDDYSTLLQQSGCRFIPVAFDNRRKDPLQDLSFYRQLKQHYKQERPDFIFHFVAKPNIYGSLAAAALDIPSVAVITGLGYPFARRNWLYWVLETLYKRALRKTKEVWFLNNEDAKIFITKRIVNIEKVKVLPGEGINTEYFARDNSVRHKPESFRFLMSTRLLKSKGVSLYADAARILKKKNYDVQFQLIGFFEKNHPDSIDQEDLDRWQQEGLIQYSGFAKDVRPYLQNADCFVFPSFYNEGIPRCLMEAASMELPIVTSNNRGCREVVLNNSTGFLCKLHDPFDLADKMERMINLSANERQRMGQHGRALVHKKFSIEKVIAEYTDTLTRDLPD